MRLLITGADGFVGRWLVRAARDKGYHVVASIMPGSSVPAEWGSEVATVHADLREPSHYRVLADLRPDAVVHLAAIASGAEARRDPATALKVNGAGTAMLASELARASLPRFLLISSAEVYGATHLEPIRENAERHPVSPYGISKAGAEVAVLAERSASGLPVVIARSFPHTGPGQQPSYVLPALAMRLRDAKRTGAKSVPTGNLSAVRDFLDVRDVVTAYLRLLEDGTPGEIYNVSSGVGRRLADCFDQIARIIGCDARAEAAEGLLRPDDIPVLIGDSTKLRDATGWLPEIPFDQTLQDLVNAQAD